MKKHLITSEFSKNSEANASEFKENPSVNIHRKCFVSTGCGSNALRTNGRLDLNNDSSTKYLIMLTYHVVQK